ncbi:MAG: hypothetical protein HGA45_07750 [Chloroflexales bacterium]|nr:hypothetical protein [Chloroflexales bacterium]
MATTDTRPAADDVSEAGAQRLHLTTADHAAIARALAEPGIALTADELEQLLAGADDEVHDLLAAGRVAEAVGVARFNLAEAALNWDEPRNHPLSAAELA